MSDRGWGRVRARVGLAAMIACAMCLTAAPAASEGYVGVAGGGAIPWSGDPGFSVLGEIGYNAWGSKFFRAGGEFEFRQQQAGLIASSSTLNLNEYHLRFLGRFMFNPGKLSPYIGGGGGLVLLQTPATTATTPAMTAQLGVGGTVIGLAGIEWPFAEGRVTIFGEGRFGWTWPLSGDFSHVDQKGLDGFTGVIGIRSFF